METLKYTVVAPKRPGNMVTFGFHPSSYLIIEMSFNVEVDPAFHQAVLENIPYNTKALLSSMFYEGCEIKQLNTPDLSFEAFWNTYKYKVGKKARVRARWEELSEDEKLMALLYIPRYRKYCREHHIEMCYPETFINQQRWENILPA